jgi:hypothetical protein
VTAMAHSAGTWHAGTRRLNCDGPIPGAGAEIAGDRSAAVPARARTVRSWQLLVLAAPAAAEVWSGRVGIAQKTGFGLIFPLPGIWPSLHLDTTITLPVSVEAYAACEQGLPASRKSPAAWPVTTSPKTASTSAATSTPPESTAATPWTSCTSSCSAGPGGHPQPLSPDSLNRKLRHLSPRVNGLNVYVRGSA